MANTPIIENSDLVNQAEDKNFFRSALQWQGSVTPHILPRVAVVGVYSACVYGLSTLFPKLEIPITPFEYSGAVLSLILVLRLNAGLDRWWEARKVWGSIVNQSRNLAIIAHEYLPEKRALSDRLIVWVAAWPHVMRESLRGQNALTEVTNLLGKEDADRIREAQHMPTYVGARIAKLLYEMRKAGMDDFSFLRAEEQRALLIDAIGKCERIRNTPIPLVLAIKTRRFIMIFLLLLPFALIDDVGYFMPAVVMLSLYPLFSLDEIGAELQNPFSANNLSHLPLESICTAIEANVLSLTKVGV